MLHPKELNSSIPSMNMIAVADSPSPGGSIIAAKPFLNFRVNISTGTLFTATFGLLISKMEKRPITPKSSSVQKALSSLPPSLKMPMGSS
jgi:hypothetical protein